MTASYNSGVPRDAIPSRNTTSAGNSHGTVLFKAASARRGDSRRRHLERCESPRACIAVVHPFEKYAVVPALFQRVEEERMWLPWVEEAHLDGEGRGGVRR